MAWLKKIADSIRTGLGRGTLAGPTDNHVIGYEGESEAVRYLRREKGYSIVVRNWRNPRRKNEEIDVVCRDGDALVFVEVKVRAAGALQQGYESVNHKKREILRGAVRAYLRGLGPGADERTVRFDVVEIERHPDGRMELRHFENVSLFTPGAKRY